MAGAVVVVSLLGARWLFQSRPDPLGGAVARPNRLAEEALVLAALAYLVAYTLLSGLAGVAGAEAHSGSRMLLGAGAQLGGMVACLVLARRHFEGGVRAFLWGPPGSERRRGIRWTLMLTLLAIGLCPIVLNATLAVIEYFRPGFDIAPHPTLRSMHEAGLPGWVHLALWGGAVVVAPLAEEFFFRGILQNVIGNLTGRRWVAIVGASAVFAGVHVAQPYALPALFFLGVILGFAYERTGMILVPVAIHAAFNLKTMVWEALLVSA